MEKNIMQKIMYYLCYIVNIIVVFIIFFLFFNRVITVIKFFCRSKKMLRRVEL